MNLSLGLLAKNPVVALPALLTLYIILFPGTELRTKLVSSVIGFGTTFESQLDLVKWITEHGKDVTHVPLIGTALENLFTWGASNKGEFLIVAGTFVSVLLSQRRYAPFLALYYYYSVFGKDHATTHDNLVFSSVPMWLYTMYGHSPSGGFQKSIVYLGYFITLAWWWKSHTAASSAPSSPTASSSSHK